MNSVPEAKQHDRSSGPAGDPSTIGPDFPLVSGSNDNRPEAERTRTAVAVVLASANRPRDRFADFLPAGAETGDPAKTTTVLNALSADSRQEADDLLARALASGGRPWMPAQDHGFMYGVSFTDPDGHVWEVVWMDPAHVQ